MPNGEENSASKEASAMFRSWAPLFLQILAIVFGLGMFKAQIDGRFSIVNQQFTLQRALIDNDLLQLSNQINSFDNSLQAAAQAAMANREELNRQARLIEANTARLSNGGGQQ